jgi:hypothetical protein
LKLLLDTDILMDVALGRSEFGPDSRWTLQWCQQRPQSALVAWHTMSHLFYLLSAARSVTFCEAEFIITRNVVDYRGSIIAALRPREFLSRFSLRR